VTEALPPNTSFILGQNAVALQRKDDRISHIRLLIVSLIIFKDHTKRLPFHIHLRDLVFNRHTFTLSIP